MRRLQNVPRVRWQHFAWRPIIVVVIVVHVFHRSHWLSGTRGDADTMSRTGAVFIS
jgi:hypothetical protein